MKSILALFSTILLLSSCSPEGEQFGEALSGQNEVQLASLLENPDEYVGKRVHVKGTVADVCAKKGCWIDLTDEAGIHKIRVKVEDDVIVFPQEARGKGAVVEGELEKLELTRDAVLRMRAHEAEERGVPFDSSSVTGGESVYRIQGIGAVIYK